jgi:phenylacetate-CoA ligase
VTLPDYDVEDPVIDRLSRGAIEALQDERLRALIPYVRERSPFWRRKLDEAGREIRALEDLPALPFTTRAELNAEQEAHPPFGEYTCTPPESWTWLFTTSGTSGRKLKRVVSHRDWELFLGFFKRGGRPEPGELVMTLAPIDGLAGPTASVEALRRAGGVPILAGTWDTRTKVRMIEELRPAGVSGVPSYVVYLSEVAAEMGVDLSTCGIQRVHVLGEPGGAVPATRATIEERYGAPVIDGYGLSEVWPLGTNCPHSWAFHLHEDFVVVECVDPETGEAVPEGEPGELIYTNLIGDTHPLLRYRSRDIGRVTRSTPCECGHTHVRIERIEGRSDDMLWYRGVNFFPSALEDVVRRQDGLSPEYRIVLELQDGGLPRMTVQVEALGSPDDPRLRAAFAAEVRGALGVGPEIEVLAQGSLPRTEQGKARRIVDRRR